MKHEIRVYRTVRDGEERLQADRVPIAFRPDPEGIENQVVNVYDDPIGQTIIGFGGAFTESTAVTWATLPGASRAELLRAYFSREDGHGYTFCRTHMNSCDFSTGNYACADVPGDTALEHFTLERERQTMIPMMRAAAEYGGYKLFVSPWSPRTKGSRSGD